MPDTPNLQTIRLQNYDYREANAYFVTICTHNKVSIFGKIVSESIELSTSGEITQQAWAAIPEHFPYVELDEFVVMPNHVHGIVVITPKIVEMKNSMLPKTQIGPLPGSLSTIIRSFN